MLHPILPLAKDSTKAMLIPIGSENEGEGKIRVCQDWGLNEACSQQNCIEPSFLMTVTAGEAQGLELSLRTPCATNSWTCLLNSWKT